VFDARLETLKRDVRAVRLENDLVSVSILVDKGADIYELIYKPRGIDVLWKSPWGLRRPGAGTSSAFNSSVAWIEAYEGGWQLLFPSGGGPCTYKGVELNFHGEASTVAWDIDELGSSSNGACVRLSTRLARSPFGLEREVRLSRDAPCVHVRERIRNEAREMIDYMWGHHPAFGAPFISQACRIDTNARRIIGDDAYDPPANPFDLGTACDWPRASREGVEVDLSQVPGEADKRAALAYFADYEDETAWYGITNTDHGFGVGLAWQRIEFPHAWFWQEMHASPGFPWYQGVYVMAIEPNTSYPGQGLVAVSEKTQTHRTLQPGETKSAEICAVFYESSAGISGLDMAGKVRL
jgi:galactose mutarotase-like enzyme